MEQVSQGCPTNTTLLCATSPPLSTPHSRRQQMSRNPCRGGGGSGPGLKSAPLSEVPSLQPATYCWCHDMSTGNVDPPLIPEPLRYALLPGNAMHLVVPQAGHQRTGQPLPDLIPSPASTRGPKQAEGWSSHTGQTGPGDTLRVSRALDAAALSPAALSPQSSGTKGLQRASLAVWSR